MTIDWFDTRQKHTRPGTASDHSAATSDSARLEAVVHVQTTRRDGRDIWVRGYHATTVAAVFALS